MEGLAVHIRQESSHRLICPVGYQWANLILSMVYQVLICLALNLTCHQSSVSQVGLILLIQLHLFFFFLYVIK